MTGTTEQAPQSDITGPTPGNGAARGAAEVHEPVLAAPALEDLDGIDADALLQDGANDAILPKPRPRVVSVPMSLGGGNGDTQATDPVRAI